MVVGGLVLWKISPTLENDQRSPRALAIPRQQHPTPSHAPFFAKNHQKRKVFGGWLGAAAAVGGSTGKYTQIAKPSPRHQAPPPRLPTPVQSNPSAAAKLGGEKEPMRQREPGQARPGQGAFSRFTLACLCLSFSSSLLGCIVSTSFPLLLLLGLRC